MVGGKGICLEQSEVRLHHFSVQQASTFILKTGGEVKMSDLIGGVSQRSLARAAGLLYLLYIVTYPLSSFIHHKSIVRGDAATTARNIIASERMFRVGFMSAVIATLFFLLAAWALYVLLKPVGKDLALLFLLLNVVGAAVEFSRAMVHFAAVPVLFGGDYLKVFQTNQLQALSLLFLSLSGTGGIITTLFYGAWLFPLGYLVLRSNFLPRVLGLLLLLDGVCLLICFFQLCLLPGHEKWTYPLFPIMFIAEFGFSLWLLIKGVRDEKKSFAAFPVA
jgi:hypothetical protein